MSENETAVKTYADFTLPASVVSRVDVSRLVTEIEHVDNELTTAAVRSKGSDASPHDAPVLSTQLTEFLHDNQLELNDEKARADLIKQMHHLKDKAPMIHMTFAVTADRQSLMTLADWLRKSVHPQAVIEVGLQPALVAGVYLRTPNHVKDLSLRGALDGSHDVLVKQLEALRGVK